MKKTKYLGLSLMFIALSSCQIKVGDIESNSTITSIEGTWSTDCMANSSDSYIKTFTVENGAMTMATLTYKDTRTCLQDNLDSTVIQNGLFINSEDGSTIFSGRTYEWHLNLVTLTPHNAQLTSALNTANICGFNNWALNQPGSIFGCSAGAEFDLSQVNENTVHYGVYTIEGSATPNYLQFGTDCALSGYQGVCPSASDRPTSLDGTVYFKR